MNEHDRAELEKLRVELAAEEGVPVEQVTIHVCGSSECQHDHDGPEVEGEGGTWVSRSCSKCGSLSIDRAYWELP